KELQHHPAAVDPLAVGHGDGRLQRKAAQIVRYRRAVHPVALAPDIETHRVFHARTHQAELLIILTAAGARLRHWHIVTPAPASNPRGDRKGKERHETTAPRTRPARLTPRPAPGRG